MSGKHLKNKFMEARDKAKKGGVPNTAYTVEMIGALRDMAEMDVYPDGNFGDIDCNIWSMFSVLYETINDLHKVLDKSIPM